MSKGPLSSPSVATLQAALVRALADELEHYSPTDPHARLILEQLREEEDRLAHMLGESAAA